MVIIKKIKGQILHIFAIIVLQIPFEYSKLCFSSIYIPIGLGVLQLANVPKQHSSITKTFDLSESLYS